MRNNGAYPQNVFTHKHIRLTTITLLWGLLVLGATWTVVRGFEQVRQENLSAAQEATAVKLQRTLDLGYFSLFSKQAAGVANVEEAAEFLNGEGAAPEGILRAAQRAVDAQLVYLLNREGECRLSVGNEETAAVATSMIGKDYGFRPYFKAAMEGKSSVTFAQGVDTDLPGLYFSAPVRLAGSIVGTAVVKAGTDGIIGALQQEDCALGVVDQNGIVIASNREEWLYAAVQPLSAATEQRLRETRQFEGVERPEQPLLEKPADTAERMVLRRELSPAGWQLISIVDRGTAPLHPQQRNSMTQIIVLLALAMLALLLLLYTYDSNIMRKTDLRKLYEAVEQTPQTVMMTDTEGHIEYVNPSFTQLTGYRAEEVLGENPRLLKSGEHDQDFYRRFWETIRAGKKWQGEFCNRRKDGSLYWEAAHVSPIKDRRQKIIGYVDIKSDITERKAREKRTSREARIDELTHLLNRRAGMEALQRSVEQAATTGSNLTIAFVDVNGLKRINDTYGHAAGDEMICRIAETIQGRIRSSDTVARLGGDEFLVILSGCDLQRAEEVWQTIEEELLARRACGQCAEPLSASAGIAALAELEGGYDAQALLNVADHRMYDAKEASRALSRNGDNDGR